MNFLFPQAWFLALLAIPVILFYLIRALPRQRPVSTLLFWDRIDPKMRSSPLWRKLRRILSLLLQLLFLLLLILAVARLLASWQGSEPESVVFVLDTSASMNASDGGVSGMEKAKRLVRDRIVNLRPSDDAMLIAADAQTRIVSRWTANRRILLDNLETVEPGPSGGSVPEAVALAADLVAQRGNGRVILVTDGVLAETLPDTETNLEVIRAVGADRSNVGIAAFSARRSRIHPETIVLRAKTVRSEIESDHMADAEPVRLELRINNRLVDVVRLDFDASNANEETWRFEEAGSASLSARLVGREADGFPEDDRAALDLDAVEILPVRLVSERNLFLEAILASLDSVDAARIPPETALADPDALYVFNRTLPPEDFAPRAMILIQPEGTGIWGERLDGTTEETLISEWEEESDPLRFADLDQVLFSPFARYEPPASATILAESFGEPVLFGEWEGENRWIATAFGLEQNDLVYRTVFPVFIGNLVRSLSRSADTARASLPGEVESRLSPLDSLIENDGTVEADGPREKSFLPVLPFHAWLLLAAVGWTFLEWRLFHRRITE